MDIDSRLQQIEKKLEILERANRQVLESLSKLSDSTKDAYSDMKILIGEDEPKSPRGILLQEQEVKQTKHVNHDEHKKLPPLPGLEALIDDETEELEEGSLDIVELLKPSEEIVEEEVEVGILDVKNVLEKTIEEDEEKAKEGNDLFAGLAKELHGDEEENNNSDQT